MSWGGIRKGAGRPKQVEIRKNKSIRVFDEEWEIIKPVINLIKKNNKIGRDLLNKNKEHKKIMVKDAQFINLTDKDITIYGKNHTTITFPKSGTVAFVKQQDNILDEACVDGCLFDIGKRIYTEVGNVPKPEENIFYIVPVVVAQQLPERDDLLVASNSIKNENGEIVGFTSLNVIQRADIQSFFTYIIRIIKICIYFIRVL